MKFNKKNIVVLLLVVVLCCIVAAGAYFSIFIQEGLHTFSGKSYKVLTSIEVYSTSQKKDINLKDAIITIGKKSENCHHDVYNVTDSNGSTLFSKADNVAKKRLIMAKQKSPQSIDLIWSNLTSGKTCKYENKVNVKVEPATPTSTLSSAEQTTDEDEDKDKYEGE